MYFIFFPVQNFGQSAPQIKLDWVGFYALHGFYGIDSTPGVKTQCNHISFWLRSYSENKSVQPTVNRAHKKPPWHYKSEDE